MTENNSQKGFVMPAIMAVIGLIVLVAGFSYYGSEKKPQAQVPAISEKTSDDAMMAKKDGETMMQKIASITMTAQNGSSQTGVATITPMDSKTKVVITIPASTISAIGVPQPAHIHMGACTNPGAVAYPLTSVTDGKSETILDISFDALQAKLPLAINVHKSKDEAKIYTSCGDISNGAMPTTGKGETMMKKEETAMMDKGGMVMKYSGTVLAGTSAPLLDFTKADYDMAIKSNKLIVLFFYANWCPICKAEIPVMQKIFDGLSTDNVIGFRVNYKDDATDGDEKALAGQFGVAYQHTKVFVKNGQRILKSPESWDASRYNTEINKALTQ